MAIGGAGGALLGGFLTHEWDEHKEHEKEDEFRAEERHQQDEIDALRRENADERRENQSLQGEVYREENRPVYGGGDERRGYDDGYGRQDSEYIQRDDTFVENRYVDERREDVYEQRDTFVERNDDYERRDEYVQEDYGRRDDYRDDSLVDDAARWVGREEQKVDDIPYDVERRWDRVEDSFEGGRNEQRYDDDRY